MFRKLDNVLGLTFAAIAGIGLVTLAYLIIFFIGNIIIGGLAGMVEGVITACYLLADFASWVSGW